MRPMTITGQCVRWLSGKLKEIGFKNIKAFQLQKEGVYMHMYNHDVYLLSIHKVSEIKKNVNE